MRGQNYRLKNRLNLNIVSMVSKWVPNKEKSAFVSFAYVGGTFGSIITNPICGVIISSIGWEVCVTPYG